MLSTVCVFVVALLLYVTRIVRPTRKLAFAVIAGMGGLGLLYLFVFVLSIFDWGWLYSDSFRTIGIAVTVIAVILAALPVGVNVYLMAQRYQSAVAQSTTAILLSTGLSVFTVAGVLWLLDVR